MMTLIIVVVATVLIMVFVFMSGQIWGFVKVQGKAVLVAINDILAGRPPWLK
jgi:hypothetical protein